MSVPVDHRLLLEVKRLCDKIINSPPETPIKGEIESMAWALAHWPEILNAENY